MRTTEAWNTTSSDIGLDNDLLNVQFPRLPDVTGQFLHVPTIHISDAKDVPVVPTEQLFSLPDEVLDNSPDVTQWERPVYTNTFLDTVRGLQNDPQLRHFFTQQGLGDEESLTSVLTKKLSTEQIDGFVEAALEYSQQRRQTLAMESQPGFTDAIDPESLQRYNSLVIDERKAVAETLSATFKDVEIRVRHAKSDIVNDPILGQLIGADRIATISQLSTHRQVEALHVLKSELERQQAAIEDERQVAAEKAAIEHAAEAAEMRQAMKDYLERQAAKADTSPHTVVLEKRGDNVVISSRPKNDTSDRPSKGTGRTPVNMTSATAVALIASTIAPPTAALAQGLTVPGNSTKDVSNVVVQPAARPELVVPLKAPAPTTAVAETAPAPLPVAATPDTAAPPASTASSAPAEAESPAPVTPAPPETPAPAADPGSSDEVVPQLMAPPEAAPTPGNSGNQSLTTVNSAPSAAPEAAPVAAPQSQEPVNPPTTVTPQAVAPVPAAGAETSPPPAPGVSEVTPVSAPAPTAPVLVEQPKAPLTRDTRTDVIDYAWNNVQQIVAGNSDAIRQKTQLPSLDENPAAVQTITNIDKLAHSIIVNRTHGEKNQADVDLLAKEMASVMLVARYPQLATDVLNGIDDKVVEKAMQPARKDRRFQEDLAKMIRNSVFDNAGGYTPEQEQTISNLMARAITVASPRSDERHEIKALLEHRMGQIRWGHGPSAEAFVKGGIKSVAVTQGLENGTIKHEVRHSPVSPAVGKGMSEKAKAKFHEYLQDASEEYGVPANFIAAFYYVENARTGDATNNRDAASGTPATGNGNWREPAAPEGHGDPWAVSRAGASGPFQVIRRTFESFGVDANGDGVKNVTAFKDATYTAANLLKNAGAHKGASYKELWNAAFTYNHSSTYAHSVMNVFRHLEGLRHGAEHTVDTGKALSAHREADNAAEEAAAQEQAQMAQAQAPSVVPAPVTPPASVANTPTAPVESAPVASAPPSDEKNDGIIVPVADGVITAIDAAVQPGALENSPNITAADQNAGADAPAPLTPEADANVADPENPVTDVVRQSLGIIHDIAHNTRDDERQAAAEAAAKHEIEGARNLGIHLTYVKGQPIMQRLYAIEGFKSSSEESAPGNKFYVDGANGEVIVNGDMAPKVVALFKDVKEEYGITLTATSSYRTNMHQAEIAGGNGNRNEVAATGMSNHQAGAAIDFNIGGSMEATAYRFGPDGVRVASGKIYEALSKLAPKHGLKQYANEPWHFSLNGH